MDKNQRRMDQISTVKQKQHEINHRWDRRSDFSTGRSQWPDLGPAALTSLVVKVFERLLRNQWPDMPEGLLNTLDWIVVLLLMKLRSTFGPIIDWIVLEDVVNNICPPESPTGSTLSYYCPSVPRTGTKFRMTQQSCESASWKWVTTYMVSDFTQQCDSSVISFSD